MASDVEIGRALAAVAATLNDQRLESFDTARVQQIVTDSLGGEPLLKVDDGGGLHNAIGGPGGRDSPDAERRVDHRAPERSRQGRGHGHPGEASADRP